MPGGLVFEYMQAKGDNTQTNDGTSPAICTLHTCISAIGSRGIGDRFSVGNWHQAGISIRPPVSSDS